MPLSTKGNESMTRNKHPTESEEERTDCEAFALLNEFREIYEGRIRRIDEDVGRDGTEIKVKVLQSWVTELGEQNAMLIQTVAQLERQAADHVSLLQESLQRSSQAALAYMTKLDDYDKDVSVEKDKDTVIADLKAELVSLRLKLDKCEDEKGSEVSKLKEEIRALKEDDKLKEEQIQGFVRRIQELCGDMHDRYNQDLIEPQSQSADVINEPTNDKFLTWSIEELDAHLQKILQGVEYFKTQLKKRMAEIEELHRTVNDMDKSAKDMREALTAEVADKHDQILALRREVQLLEQRCRQADMQTHFKDDIIKEMRKDIKVARLKLASLDPDHQQTMVNTDQQCMSSFLFYNHPTLHLSQFSSLSPNNQQEHCLPNVTQHHYNHPNEYQWVKFPADKSNQQFQQVHTSPQKLYHSFLPYQQFCTPEKLSSPLNEKLYGNGSTDETPLQSACQCNPSLENTHLPYIPGITDQLGAEETYYEVRRRNSPPSRDAQASAEGRVMSGDTVSPQNLVLQCHSLYPEATCSKVLQTLVPYHNTTRHHNPEDLDLNARYNEHDPTLSWACKCHSSDHHSTANHPRHEARTLSLSFV